MGYGSHYNSYAVGGGGCDHAVSFRAIDVADVEYRGVFANKKALAPR